MGVTVFVMLCNLESVGSGRGEDILDVLDLLLNSDRIVLLQTICLFSRFLMMLKRSPDCGLEQ